MTIRQRNAVEIPYPAVFHDWRSDVDVRVATSTGIGGIRVEVMVKPMRGERGSIWCGPELTEDDACLLAASLLQRAAWVNGEPPNRVLEKLSQRIVDAIEKL